MQNRVYDMAAHLHADTLDNDKVATIIKSTNIHRLFMKLALAVENVYTCGNMAHAS